MSSSFDDSLRWGQLGESAIAKWLNTKGYAVLPVYEKDTGDYKGPQVFCADRNMVAPDLLCFKPERVLWVEAKRKSVFSWFRQKQQWETGIDLHHYQQYLELRRRAPWPLWLMFLHEKGHTDEWPHECPTGLFGREILSLQRRESHTSDRHGRHGMVYWAHKHLWPLATLEEMAL